MSGVVVVGVANLETTVAIDGFPLAYEPVRYRRFGIRTGVGGVGFNVARALQVLGHDVTLASLVGGDVPGRVLRDTIQALGMRTEFVLSSATHTPQSVVLYDPQGARQINTDLGDVLDLLYPPERFTAALGDGDCVVLTNVNFTRGLLGEAKRRGVTIATDVHAIHDLAHEYHQDYLAAADILFMSHERLPTAPDEWLKRLMAKFTPEVAVVGLGGQGALLAVRGEVGTAWVPAVRTREVVSTVGAGDALLASFVHFYRRGWAPLTALRHAVVFASYKLGEAGASNGFLCEDDLVRLTQSVGPPART